MSANPLIRYGTSIAWIRGSAGNNKKRIGVLKKWRNYVAFGGFYFEENAGREPGESRENSGRVEVEQ